MEKLEKLEAMLKYEILKTTRKQNTILAMDPLRFKTIQQVMNDLEVNDSLDYIKRMYYYWKINECNRYLTAIKNMKAEQGL